MTGLPVTVTPRTVLMTADAIGGVWGYAIELAHTLANAGVQVHLATMGRLPGEAQRAEAAAVPGLVLHESEYRLEWMDEPWGDVARAGEWLLALEREIRPDVVHLNGYAHGALPFTAPTLVVAHSCVCSWWRAVHGVDAPAEWNRYRAAVSAGLAGADLVVAPTAAMLASLALDYGFTGPGRVIPNAREAARFLPRTKRPYVVAAGRVWDEGKNIAAVAEAAARVKWPVFIAGDETPPAGAAGVRRASDEVQYVGRLSEAELARWMGHAAICALPVRYEPFGLTAIEAGLAGCALVLGDIPTLREVWGGAPLWVQPDDTNALARAICALVDDPDLRELVAARCRATALQYSPARMADAYLGAYATLLHAPDAALAAGAPTCG